MSFFLELFFSRVVLFAVISYLAIYYFAFSRKINQWKCANIPYLKPVFPFGHRHFIQMLTKSPVVPLDQIYRENEDKDLVAFFMTVSPVILLRNPKLIKKIYAKNLPEVFENGFFPVDEVEYQSVVPLSSDKALWKIGRRALAPSLSPSRFKNSDYGIFKKQIDRLWYHAEQAETLGQPLNGKDAAHNFVVDNVSLWNFGVDGNSWETKTEFYKIIGSIFDLTHLRLVSFFVLALFPFLQALNPLRFIRLDYIHSVTVFLRQTIEQRDKHHISHDDFIDHLMSLRSKSLSEGTQVRTADSNLNEGGISLKEMAGYTLTWLLAGADTTSQLCMFALHLLSLHPEYQARIKKETDEAMKKHNASEVTFEVMRELKFTEYCLLETSRLYPILPAIMRCCSEDLKIPGTNFILRKGDRVIIPPYSLHRDPLHFKDPDTFYPDRFSPENRDLISLDMFVSFGAGPRKCPGYKIGVSIATMFVASLLYKYEVRPRSHTKQMDATDFDSRGFTAQHTGKFLVDLVPHNNLIS